MTSLRACPALVAWGLTALVSPAFADGGVALGVTTLLQSGDPATKVDITFLGDGFTAEQQDKFNAKVDELVKALMATHPVFPLRSAFNIHRVNVGSPESGTDKFAKCGDEDVQDNDDLKDTALDTGFCAGGAGNVNRCLLSSDPAEVLAFAAASPDDERIIVLVNESQRGGCASGGIGYLSLSSDFAEVFVHELGHSLFGLADEYEYDSEDGTYTGSEPGSINVTTRTTRDTLLKWQDMILASTPVPTEDDQDCDATGGSGPGFPLDLIGSYEGASYHRCNIYRPQPDCKMRHSDEAFCSVCRRKIIRDLADNLNTDQSVRLTHLLIRDDNDPWPSGSGEIFINYTLKTGLETQSGRVPSDDHFSMDDGDSRDLEHTLGPVAQRGPQWRSEHHRASASVRTTLSTTTRSTTITIMRWRHGRVRGRRGRLADSRRSAGCAPGGAVRRRRHQGRSRAMDRRRRGRLRDLYRDQRSATGHRTLAVER